MKKAWTPAFAGVTTFLFSSFLLAAPQTTEIKAPDGTVLRAIFSAPASGKPVALMVHGLDSVKEEWQPLMAAFDKAGIGYLAYDARHHGTPWEKWVDDQGVMIRYIESKEVPRANVILVGASLGANVSLKYAALTGVGKAVIMLSPGLNYQGVTTADAITKVTKPVLIVTSEADVYANQSSNELKKLSPKIQVWKDVKAGHGAQMFDETLLRRLVEWIKLRK